MVSDVYFKFKVVYQVITCTFVHNNIISEYVIDTLLFKTLTVRGDIRFSVIDKHVLHVRLIFILTYLNLEY